MMKHTWTRTGLVLVALLVVLLAPVSSAGAQKAGTVVFGTSFSQGKNTFQIHGQRSTFHIYASSKFAWVVALTQEAGTRSLAVSIAKVYSGGAEVQVFTTSTAVSNPRFEMFANSVSMSVLRAACGGPGTFIMRYFNGNTELAEGRFKLVK